MSMAGGHLVHHTPRPPCEGVDTAPGTRLARCYACVRRTQSQLCDCGCAHACLDRLAVCMAPHILTCIQGLGAPSWLTVHARWLEVCRWGDTGQWSCVALCPVLVWLLADPVCLGVGYGMRA
jgi:hypothetical protein